MNPRLTRGYRKIRHYLHGRPRFLFSILMATVIYLCLTPFFSPAIRLMFGWNVFAWLYILFLLAKIVNRRAHDIRKITRLEDESAKMVIFFVVIGCCISVLVLFLELATAGQISGHQKILHFIITGSTLLSSWLLLPMGFTMHYAHVFYANPRADDPWLLFPDKIQAPSYWDFMYFSFTIAVASQTADVCVGSQEMRKIVLLQSVISFVFNMAILGLSINVCASLF
ncbi:MULTISPECIES: DUF1345 domain-containing protein [Edwardsiella]|uniref:Transmembrane protein n=2 Tax=Edwardsiella anguillarum TaxID=1821960 RepID=A0A076LMW3_9GAMM|nr:MULTISPECIES: DUF1345 domain-containing protein [Edwardsiella]AKM47275.1 membrane protein [Edwardsiella sp. EA181011]AIJ07029.1 Hypothetical protein ETEE_0555 [Edwardsiella anguillarum ET080813]AKR78434.1 DUF1345 domain-containing protein [Edwardsiella sp. LADL05-105]KAB0586265.1 DUF1345 domain-containing protein [Edwardsiella anguillarum]RFT03538.1 DUF1345 domain-containing protein [Edwardsiella anguillarum]